LRRRTKSSEMLRSFALLTFGAVALNPFLFFNWSIVEEKVLARLS